ncbi:MAG: BtpA/SgcQ family protein [Euryarchaeota archaeon]|nr:BtpA/SgcQ family protein [Euryarchaeota archaeon]
MCYRGTAPRALRLREQLDVDTRIPADTDVKHAARPAADRSVGDQFADLVERGLTDGVIVIGAGTGTAVDGDTLEWVAAARPDYERWTPLFVGSGVTPDSVDQLLAVADGAIVGTAPKDGGQTTKPVDVDRIEELLAAVEAVRTPPATQTVSEFRLFRRERCSEADLIFRLNRVLSTTRSDSLLLLE